MKAATQIFIPEKKPDYTGKVRDIYHLDNSMLLVATDRISAFDVVFNEGIPDRGKILTRISNHWFHLLSEFDNHILETDFNKFPEPFNKYPELFAERSVLVKKAERIDFECVVRGFLLGSGYKEYEKSGTVCGEKLPSGLSKGGRLPEPIFTPATKVDKGHDENVSFDYMRDKLGDELAGKLKDLSIKAYNTVYEKLYKNGILLADTKLEFGILDNKIILIDEIFTPDSSRFFKIDEYENAVKTGENPPSFDKQIIRDYLETLDWNKNPPPPPLPEDIIEKSGKKYKEIEEIVLCITKE
ncbi:MAG: phosphoribosylaminoimidazolesuccinocarboxamide synthase [Spirochaetia bacterium]|nr:phosphoribosylaminoimidazolesuccinocarboxamide synthase [Spirochaetia bacterium]